MGTRGRVRSPEIGVICGLSNLIKLVSIRPAAAGLVVSLAQFLEKRISLGGQPLFKFLRAITVATSPGLCPVLMPASAPGMCVLQAEQFKIFFPISAFLSERWIAKAGLNPGREPPDHSGARAPCRIGIRRPRWNRSPAFHFRSREEARNLSLVLPGP
jgi:hypothetical protein